MADPKPWEIYAAPRSAPLTPGGLGGGVFVPAQVDPSKAPTAEANLTGQNLDNRITTATLPAKIREANADATIAEGKVGDSQIDNTMKLRGAFEAQPGVKEYRSAIPQMTAGLKTSNNPAGDNALIYAYAKVMDPGSAVRESEAAGVANSDTIFGRAYAYAQKQLSGQGTFSPEAREGLRREMLRKAGALNGAYNTERERYIADAKAWGIDPARVVGKHSGATFLPQIKAYAKAQTHDPAMSSALDRMVREGRSFDDANAFVTGKGGTPIDRATYKAATAHSKANPGYTKSYGSVARAAPGYDESMLSQGMSGVNEGLASVAGAPVDLVTGAINLGAQGINALANTNIPIIENPTLGSQWIKDRMGGQIIAAPTGDPTKQVVRRIGESVGAAAIPAGFAGSLGRGAGQLIAGAGGGVGAAGAQQAFPGNPIAEMAGEVLGGGLTAGGLIRVGQRNAQRAIEAAVPSSEQLRDQAGQLYRQAEANGVVATPDRTEDLADTIRRTLTDEGHVSPTGRISEVYPKARQALQLADDYAGQPMNPTQMQTVRKIAADGLSSPDATERRLGRLLTENVDDWAAPMAPELAQARGVARRYLVAGELEQARELAGARAGQFSGSGFENALRTDYRALDRAEIKGQMQFPPEVTDQIRNVARGTPVSNVARGIGRLAPTGVVSGALGGLLPGMAMAGATGSTMAGGLTGLALSGAGIAGREVATRMGLRAADIAELTARNGGALPQAAFSSPEIMQALHALAAAESTKYLSPEYSEGAENQQPYANPNPFAGGISQRKLAPAPGALAFPFR